ncbi:redox-sensing transcriptional repressor Rex [Ammoniphilus sp. CFH 90114]|uniref:redox-sensing transcriptional repressor Rex n=1 Tax=Ammoniphilus sp. CFH 90114 TaxID=2493665 RepID=UPI00100FF921|nr:redox-sensing transcriptional repressor Rex [Ammoniphilus sp. CFH 90114]RXT05188.1 redox-sensing transcriptional repressor Rex [Ammoniphilus sp. CFH 90114]
MEQAIPKVTAKRLPIYFRYLHGLSSLGITRVSSAELSRSLNIDPATIRRDLSYLGALGRKGYGYDVEYLIQFLREFLKQDETTHVILVGVGNLGTALLQYDFLKNNAMIVAAFDNDPSKVGQKINGIPIYPLNDFVSVVEEEDALVAILTVPVHAAQDVTDQLVKSGIKGILNFTPTRLQVPEDIKIHYIDLSVELQSLVYFLKKNEPVVVEENE